MPNQHDQIFLKLNQMIYWLTKIIHTLASVKKKLKLPWEGVGRGSLVLRKMPQGSCR